MNSKAKLPPGIQPGSGTRPDATKPRTDNEEMVPNGPARPYMTVRAKMENEIFCRVHELEEPLRWLGSLAHSETAATMRLTKEQIAQITRLDELTRKTQGRIAREALAFLDKPPALRRDLYKRNEALEKEVVGHAEAMVPSGLLTSSQVALLRKWRWSALGTHAFRDEDVARFLRLTKEQKKELAVRYARVDENVAARMPLMFSTARDAPARVTVLESADKQLIWEVLDPLQEAQWIEALSADVVPSGVPSSATVTTNSQKRRLAELEMEVARVRKEAPSKIFGALADPAIRVRLATTEEQIHLLDELDKVARAGRGFIILSRGASATSAKGAKTRRQEEAASDQAATFIRHAERIAVAGILTSDQGEQLKGILERK